MSSDVLTTCLLALALALYASPGEADEIVPEWLLEAAPAPAQPPLRDKASHKPPAASHASARSKPGAPAKPSATKPRKAPVQYQYTIIGGC